jgi:hypothetical protein
MVSATGIELGRESCVLVGIRASRAGTADVRALHIIEPGAWPTTDLALIETLRSLRGAKGFPRDARIVAWGLPDDSAGDKATVRALQRPVVAAGFRVESILTPPQALALLAASRPRHAGDGAVAWLALNMHGAAIAIVRDGELLFARTFKWAYNTGVMTGKAQLLQRYSLVAQLAPEVHRGIAAVRASRRIAVDAAVTCGDLPDLRSLTMPLIEELDLEVETLDSTEGLRAIGTARAERFAESAPAIRLACAAAMAPRKRRAGVIVTLARVAAVLALIAALAWGGFAYWRGSAGRTADPPHAAARRPPPQAASSAPASAKPGAAVGAPGSAAARPTRPNSPAPGAGNSRTTHPSSRAGAPVPVAPTGTAKPPGAVVAGPPAKVDPKPVPQPTANARPESTRTAAVPPAAPKVEPKPGGPQPARPNPEIKRDSKPIPVPQATAGDPAGRPTVTRRRPAVTPALPDSVERAITSRTIDSPAGVRPPRTLELPAVSPSLRSVAPRASATARPANRTRSPLKDPLPKLDSILIDEDRRLAIMNGAIVRVGDTVGLRTVVQIDRDAVILREPSGLSVRIALRSSTAP